MQVYRYKVALYINKVDLSVKFPCTLQVMLKRGNNKCTTAIKEKQNKRFIVDEELTMEVNVRQDQTKNAHLIALLNVDGSSKLAGTATFPIKDGMPLQGKCTLNLEKSPDPEAKIHIAYQIVNMGQNDTVSESRISENSNQIQQESFGLNYDKENQQIHSFSQKKMNESQKVIVSIQAQLRHKTEEVKHLQEMNGNLSRDAALHKELYEKGLKDLDNAKQQIKDIKLNSQNYQSISNTHQEECAKYKSQLEQVRNENEYLERQNDELRRECNNNKESKLFISQLQSQIGKLEIDNETAKNANAVLDAKYQHQLKRLRQLEEQVEQHNTTKSEISTNTIYYESQESVDKDKKIKQLEGKISEYQRKNEKLGIEVQMYKNKLQKADDDMHQLNGKQEIMANEYIQQKIVISGKENDIQRLRESVAKLEIELKSKISQLSSNNSDIQMNQQDYQKVKADFYEISNKYKKAKERIGQQSELIDQMNEELTVQNLQFMKELQLLAKKQEQLRLH